LSTADAVGTAQPKRPPGGMAGMFGGGQQGEPKGDISKLWKLLGVEMYGDEIVWQDFNPEPKLGQFLPRELVFVDEGLQAHGTPQPFDPDDPISAGMHQLLFLWTGSFRPAENSKLNFSKLAITGHNSGTVNYREAEAMIRSGNTMNVSRATTHEPYILAAHVKGKVRNDPKEYLSGDNGKEGKGEKADGAAKDAAKDGKPAEADAKKGDAAKPAEDDALAGKEPEKAELNVVLVADIDWILAPDVYRIRSEGTDEENSSAIDFKFQNIPFALNILDSLAGDDRFIDLRKRSRSHRILTKVEEATEAQRKSTLDQQANYFNEANKQVDAAQEDGRYRIAKGFGSPYEGNDDGARADSPGEPAQSANRFVRKGSQQEGEAKRARARVEYSERSGPLQVTGGAVAADLADLARVLRVLPPPQGRAGRHRRTAAAVRQSARTRCGMRSRLLQDFRKKVATEAPRLQSSRKKEH
jgi:ABC-2 type transport system permease protein